MPFYHKIRRISFKQLIFATHKRKYSSIAVHIVVTSLLTSLPIPFLNEHPRLLYEAAGSSCTDVFVHELNFLLASNRTWAQPPPTPLSLTVLPQPSPKLLTLSHSRRTCKQFYHRHLESIRDLRFMTAHDMHTVAFQYTYRYGDAPLIPSYFS